MRFAGPEKSFSSSTQPRAACHPSTRTLIPMPTIHIYTTDQVKHDVDLPVGRSLLDACRKASLPMEGLCGESWTARRVM